MNIWIAASDNNIDKVKEYISSGQHTANDKDPNGYTPVHAAASYGHTDLLRYLIQEAKGDINVADNDGDTALHTVEDQSVARLMVEEFKADYKIRNDEGQTALEKLQEEDEFPEVIQYLKTLQGEASVLDMDTSQLPENSSVRLTYQEDAGDNITEEQRQRVQEILNSEDPEAGLRELLRQAVRDQLQAENGDGDDDEGHEGKRRK